jgi:uncharacterized membrane protein
VNDPNTALAVVDRVRGALARLLGKSLPTGIFCDRSGRCRLRARRHSHADVLAAALRPIRDAAARQPLVVVAMLQALAKLLEHARHPAHSRAVLLESSLIADAAMVQQPPESERLAIEQARRQVQDKLRLVQASEPAVLVPAPAKSGTR